MKTLTERMDDLLSGIIYCDLRTEVGIDKAKTLIRRSLKEQDKITRHACAENVLELEGKEITDLENDEINEYVEVSDAHRIIMNTKAV